MIHIVIEGEHVPLKKDGGDEKKKKLFKRTDPIALLRNALANKLRSKHWRIAHAAKSKWMAAAKAGAKVSGDAVGGEAIVIVIHSIPGRCDIDAPIKVLLDAFQEDLFADGDDRSAESLVIRRVDPDRKTMRPQVHIYAYSKATELEEACAAAAESFSMRGPCLP